MRVNVLLTRTKFVGKIFSPHFLITYESVALLRECLAAVPWRWSVSRWRNCYGVITGVTFACTFHMWCTSIVRFYIVEYSLLLSWSRFCVQKLQRLLTYKFLLRYHELWCWALIITVVVVVVVVVVVIVVVIVVVVVAVVVTIIIIIK